MDRFNIIAVTNGYLVSRESCGGISGFEVFVETFEQACELVIKMLQTEAKMGY